MVDMHFWPFIFMVAVCNVKNLELTFYVLMCYIDASLLFFLKYFTFTPLEILDFICHRYGLFRQAFAL